MSEIAHRYIEDPNEVLKLGQHVMVMVTEVNVPRKRIALSIKQAQAPLKKPLPVKQGPDQGPKEPDTTLPITDAVALLRKKFGNNGSKR